MIEVKGLYKSFEGKTVLHNIDATFENGKTSLIIGQIALYLRPVPRFYYGYVSSSTPMSS